jgi:hypothetical protein
LASNISGCSDYWNLRSVHLDYCEMSILNPSSIGQDQNALKTVGVDPFVVATFKPKPLVVLCKHCGKNVTHAVNHIDCCPVLRKKISDQFKKAA